MAELRVLAAYLAADIEVEHKMHGRGQLIALPCTYIGQHLAEAYYTVDVAYGMARDLPLADVRPVLWHPDDIALALAATSEEKWPGLGITLAEIDPQTLEKFARLVDDARALGIALNVPADQYVRRQPTPPPADISPNQLTLF